MVFHSPELIKYAVNGSIVIGRKKDGFVIEKSGHQRIDDGIGFPGTGWSLNIGKGIFHGIVNCQKLIQIDVPVNQRNGISFPADGLRHNIPEKSTNGIGNPVILVHFDNRAVLLMKV